ncbi:MAG: GNAT family N-acetyltransferase [Verrucomicrobiae bacterium]|nr:GNAT family N-acetyltransferase [Verrucomicrobiae bacterium]
MQKDSKITFRMASGRDELAVMNVLGKAFHWKRNSERWENERKSFLSSPGAWRLLFLDGRVAGTVHIRKSWLKVGRGKLLKGDVGGVAALPEYQGQGLGTLIMQDAMEWMKKERYDLSRLGGLVRFYSRFGYKRFPRRYVEFSVGQSARAGASVVEEAEIPIPKDQLQKIRLYDPRKDFSSYARLHASFSQPYNASWIVPDKGGKNKNPTGERDPMRLVFEENGKILAYLFAVELDQEYSEFEGRITIGDVGYDRRKPHAFEFLIKHINNLALARGIKRITARMPFDPEIIEILSSMPIRFQCIETHGGKSSNMLRIIHLQSLFQRLIPELRQRIGHLKDLKGDAVVEIQTERDAVQLMLQRGTLDVVDGRKPRIHLKIGEFCLLQMILGLLSVEETPSFPKIAKNDPNAGTILRALFPRKPVASTGWC